MHDVCLVVASIVSLSSVTLGGAMKREERKDVFVLVAYALDLGGRRSEQQLEVKCA